ncbi:unnamed protein product [Blepharisma stoltei]|uniref:FAD-binding PCMH-type domain-containing protein n=1 Tax=Blepharisma stoltei TaxID=1481888 RepID=A0AAU9JMH7_9CILI|nr:unnamed protein product [Blepharisma stoltei]
MILRKISKRIFTSIYSPPRDPKFSNLLNSDMSFFESILPPHQIVKDNLEGFNTDFIGVFIGKSSLVLKPNTVNQVQDIITYCAKRKLAICPQGGNTGLVGGSVPVHDEIVLSLSNMNKLVEINESEGTVLCEAGVILEQLNSQCEEKGYIFPIDLGAKGSCFVGGNASTCAAGNRLLRYGSLHANILGLEIVTGKGEILDNLSSFRKDNTGYDLKHIFIGSEGTLGVITKLLINLPPKPKSEQLVYLGVNSFENVLKILKKSKEILGEIISAFEFQDRFSVEASIQHIQGVHDPFDAPYPFYVLIETRGSNAEHDSAKMDLLLESIIGNEAENGILPQDKRQSNDLWKLREVIMEAVAKPGYCFMYDISLKHENYYDIVEKVRNLIGEKALTVGWGHVGDGNLHLSITVPDRHDVEDIHGKLENFLFSYLKECHGSISAEHGIGLQKRNKLSISRSPAEIQFMRRIKNAFDPEGIMNPYKLFPDN